MQDLKQWFTKAELPIKVEKEPLRSRNLSVNNQDIFQMSIDTRGKKKNREYYRIFHGHKENDIRVIDIDSKKQQVILFVSEPERKYTVKQWNREKNDWTYLKQKSPGFSRKYLMGMDECHLFIAELPKDSGVINKIEDAHKVLKPKHVIDKEKETHKIKRQGEWFFIPATQQELEFIYDNENLIEKKISLSGFKTTSGNAHIADLRITNRSEIFVKGKISHIEHKTIKLHGWFKVVRNNEARTTSIEGQQIQNGVKWVD